MLTSGFPPSFVPGFHDEELVQNMDYKRLGNTDMIVSRLAFGGSEVGEVLGTDREQEMIDTIHYALRAGVNYIDTAPYYGTGNSEIMIGKALRALKVPRTAFYLATKVGRYSRDPLTMFDFSAKETRNSVKRSCMRLGVGCLDLVQIHDVEFAPNIDVIINETLHTLKEMRREGYLKYIGITGYSLDKLKQILANESAAASVDVVLSYSRFTLWDHSLQSYLPAFKKQGLGIIHAAPLGMGLLTRRPLPSWHPVTESIVKACDSAMEYCKD